MPSARGRKDQRLDLTLPLYACWVNADVIRLEQFLNVLTNAIKYTDRGGQLSARVAADSARVKVMFGDNGCIASELLPHVLRCLRRVPMRAPAASGGSGGRATTCRAP